ncbi:MAG: NAD-dependent epimerase/dehydratase family protein [Pirellulales bacterium]|nr:NAD-dependent epimerase/dehydratase family protein [Pirellulales bacterium]
MNSPYLITGGAGNLAWYTAHTLLELGKQVVLADLPPQPPAGMPEGCRYRSCDLTRPDLLRALLEQLRPQAVLHFASLLSARSEELRSAAWRLNVDAAFDLLELCLERGISRVLFPSSVASYGGTLPRPLPEDFSQWPESLYGVTKVAVERLGAYYHARYGLDFRCLRVPIVVSPRANIGAASAYVSRAFIEAARTGRYTFRVRPETAPALIYVYDVAAAFVSLLEAPAGQLSRRVYNIHALSPTAADVAACIRQRLPHARLEFAPQPDVVRLLEGWPSRVVDASARRDWGWQPQFDLDRLADHMLEELARGTGPAPSL